MSPKEYFKKTANEVKEVHEETPWWVRGAVLLVGAILAVLLVVTLGLSNSAKIASDDAKRATHDVRLIAEQNRTNAITSCEAANIAREGDIKNLLDDIDRLQRSRVAEWADVAGLRRSLITDDVWIQAHVDAARGYTKNIAQKRAAIRTKLESVEPYAIEEGSPIKNCEAVNPK